MEKKSRWFRNASLLIKVFSQENLNEFGSGFLLRDVYALYRQWHEETAVVNEPLGKLLFCAMMESIGFERSERVYQVRFANGSLQDGISFPVLPPRPKKRTWKTMTPGQYERYKEERRERLALLRSQREDRRKKREELRVQREEAEKLREQLILEAAKALPPPKSWQLRRLIKQGKELTQPVSQDAPCTCGKDTNWSGISTTEEECPQHGGRL